MNVYLLKHTREAEDEDDIEDVKTIGIYESYDNAKNAINMLSNKPGFRKYPNGFKIVEYPLNLTNWETGFGEP